MIRSNDLKFKATLKAAVLVGGILLFAAMAFGQGTVNLTVAPTTTTLPDGSVVPMWGYFCGVAVTGSTATCAALNPYSVANPGNPTATPPVPATPATWSPVVITVPVNTTAGAATTLTINLTNSLSFTPTGSTTGANTIPTSIVMVGQVGGGLGATLAQRTTTMSPDHSNAQGCVTWFIADPNTPPGVPCTANDSGAQPPAQGPRVHSFSTEVAATGATLAANQVASGSALTWSNLRAGTYLLESGTHPSIQVPMGLIGILVVTQAPSGATLGIAYPGVTTTSAATTVPSVQYNAEVPLEFSEIDPVQNNSVNTAVNTAGFSETTVWSGMVGKCGNPNSPVGVVNTCYPPTVNYTPFYYLINGLAFNKTNAPVSVFPATANGIGTSPPVVTGITGSVLVRLVNAGLRMHVPSIVGSQTQGFTGAGAAATVSGFTLIAEDGNVIPGVQAAGAARTPAAPRVQTDVFMAAGKTFDVMINAVNVPAITTALPVYDRELSLSGNSSVRDAGMLAYIGVNASGLPVSAGTGIFAAAVARADTYNSLVAGQPLTVSDPSKGVIANDTNVYGVHLLSGPASGTLSCPAQPQNPTLGICANGTFIYTPNAGSTATSDSFTYCANNAFTPAVGTTAASCSSAALTATVTLGAASVEGAAGITCSFPTPAYTAKIATYLKVPSPGVLAFCRDAAGYPLKVAATPAPTLSGGTVLMDANGGFNATLTAAPTATTAATLSFTPQNSQGTSGAGQSVTISFPVASGLQVKVLDAQAYNNCVTTTPTNPGTCIASIPTISDYRWIIEEDRTFWVDPNCTTNTGAAAPPPGCPTLVGPSGTSTIPTFAVNFHSSSMPFVAQGCTGPLSCEAGQTMLDTRPACTGTPAPAGCSATAGQHIPAVCDLGNGACRPDPNCTALPCLTGTAGSTEVLPSSVHLDPTKRYYISVLPGDAGNPFPSNTAPPTGCLSGGVVGGTLNTGCGHTMSGAPIPPVCNVLVASCTPTSTTAFAPVTVLTLPTPLPTGKLSVMVFEDDFPLNGEQDGGGGFGATVAPNEPGLGGFNIVLWDTYGGLGDVTGQNTYDMFNQPLSNALTGTIDPTTGLDACPISAQATSDPTQKGITGVIVTCPKFEADGATLSPLAGQAVIANLMPEKFSVQAYPGADRIARGEEWLQTNTLDGQHPHDSFIRIGEPSYFQEYGPAGYHVSIGFANPAIINARREAVCKGTYGAVGPCSNSITGQVDVQRLSRTPDQRLYASGSRDALIWTQCWVSLGDPDGEDFMFTKCDANGNFKFTGVPGGNWRLTIGDQWNDQIIDGLSTPANVGCVPAPGATTCTGGTSSLPMGSIGVQQWQSNIYAKVFIDDNKNGIPDQGEIGLPLAYVMIHYRDGHNSNALTTDFNGVANFNETFPLFNWYVVQADDSSTATRYKTTGIHTVYDAGGPADGTCSSTTRPCGTSTAYAKLANTYEAVPLPADLSVPGAVYCAKADCTAEAAGFAAGTAKPSTGTAGLSTGRIDPPWVDSEAWSGLTSQGNWIEIGKAPYAACNPALSATAAGNYCANVGTTASPVLVGENGGIHGIVDYASTRPFDSAQQMIQQPWEAYVPNVTINLYQESFAADGVTPILKLVDTTQTTSWDDWAQGFYPASTAGSGTGAGQKPYMSCPGQATNTSTSPAIPDMFYFTLFDQPNYLNYYNSLHGGPALTTTTLPYNSQYKCYDAMHIWNQLQPAPFDGKYSFPSVLGISPTTGKQITPTGYINPITGAAPTITGTNCTICVANPDSTDHYRVGTPMLPPGKYVVEVVMPPGYEVYKEEDKNLLIGDNYIAPVTQQFGGLGGFIFIIPDQASVASMYEPNAAGFNPNNYQNQTTDLSLQGGMLVGTPGFPGFQDPNWPCVGEQRTVPDYLSLFPQAQEVAPFAGATRPLCDRKEVTLTNQTSVIAKFFIYTSTHIASKFTGVITDDFTAEFDPFSPQFGEKFAPANLPVSTKDYLGNEISRVYSDHWGIYDGLQFSSWEVNPPNITGYSPTMMVQCMNDPGPIPDPAHPGQFITDPLYNPAYSNFCYEEPYMPGLTTYLDTPVVPTQAFVGAGYNNPDCAYPDATPAIAEVDGDGVGPWVSAAGHRLTITALGNATVANTATCTIASASADVSVTNAAYAGPSAFAAPFNCKTVTRHYGFGPAPNGAGCTGGNANAACPSVTVGGLPLHGVSWTDKTITGTLPTSVSGIPLCPVQQQTQYGGPGTTTAANAARCGQLVITAGNGKQSIDTVTVTIGGKAPTHVGASATIQQAIDAANPGDLIIVDPTCMTTGTTPAAATCSAAGLHAATPTQTASASAHTEMLIMWKPVRLQGVGAASSVVNANAHPAGKLLDPWRAHINCLFGLTLDGFPQDAAHAFNPNPAVNINPSTGVAFTCPDVSAGYSWNNFTGIPNGPANDPQVDRLPLEAVVGWDATVNGNLAELLQEPSLMGAYEGAGITVLGRGVSYPSGVSIWGDGTEAGAYPPGTFLLSTGPNGVSNPGTSGTGGIPTGDANSFCHTVTVNATTGVPTVTAQTNPQPSNFSCNPSSIDGLTVTNSSQGGGGVFVHGWAHYLQVGNNRIYNNAGTLSGGISVGQGEFAPPQVQGSATNAAPGSCSNGTGFITNQHRPACLQMFVNVHNNMITANSSIGDELFSATLSGGGGATVCTGNEYYKFNFNWVCGNLTVGEGGGMVHLGEIFNGDIEHNTFVFNQSDNPTIPTNGGGIQVQGTPDTDPVCGNIPDADCPPGLSDGTGPGLVINANLIQGNMAESGSGGGIRLQSVDGTMVSTFPDHGASLGMTCATQYTATGAFNCLWNVVSVTNNIVVNNVAGWDGAGISLQDTLVANIVNNTVAHNDSLASSGVLTQTIGAPLSSAPAGSCTNAAGTTSCPQSAGLTSTLNSPVLTASFVVPITCPAGHSGCTTFSNPLLFNDVFWQNRAFDIGVSTTLGAGTLNQQATVALFPTLTQSSTGVCAAGANYLDLGVRGGGASSLSPQYSILTSGASGTNTSAFSPVAQYCNGSRVPPECTSAQGCGGPYGFGVPPGISDAVTPNPVFSLRPSATVDEGNNWINVSWGPLSLTNTSLTGGTYGNYGGGPLLGNYDLAAATPNGTSSLNGVSAPSTDFFGNSRGGTPNVGAVQSTGAAIP